MMIFIRTGQKPTIQAETFIHEVLHAIHKTYKIPLNKEEEDVVDATGTGLTQVFKDNTEVFKWWIGLLK